MAEILVKNIPDETERELKHISTSKDISLNELILDYINAGLRKENSRQSSPGGKQAKPKSWTEDLDFV